jgi:hypothetical protein
MVAVEKPVAFMLKSLRVVRGKNEWSREGEVIVKHWFKRRERDRELIYFIGYLKKSEEP